MRDLGAAEHFIAGAIGEPGRRHFYLQVTAAGETLWFPAEKEQVAALGSQAFALLAAAELTTDDDEVSGIRGEIQLRPPDVEQFRVGGIQVAVLESELIAMVISSPEEDDSVRFLISPAQLEAMAGLALEVVEAGRPICPLCQLPMNPDGHQCPSTNGHHPAGV